MLLSPIKIQFALSVILSASNFDTNSGPIPDGSPSMMPIVGLLFIVCEAFLFFDIVSLLYFLTFQNTYP